MANTIEQEVVVSTSADTLLTVTDEARDQLKEVLAQENNPNLALRVFVQGSRASMALDDSEGDDDIVMNFDGLRILVDEDSAPYLTGAVIGFQNTLMERGFTIENANLPQSGGGCCGGGGGSCGCGH